MTKPLILIDASNLAFKCHHVNKRFNTKTKAREPFQYRGHITSALYGFFRSLLAIRRQYPESHILCAFDSRSQARHDLVAEAQEAGILQKKHGYKGTRVRDGDDYKQVLDQLDELREYLPLTRVQVVKIKDQEADDIVGTYAVHAPSAVIASSDHDFYQLVSESVIVYDAMKNKTVTLDLIREEFGLEPGQMVDLGALQGDNSDNIPGLPGIGPKRALDLIRSYGSLDQALVELEGKRDEGKRMSKIETTLLENRDLALCCRELKRIRTDLDVPVLESTETDPIELERLFKEVWGFKSLLPHLDLLV